MFCNKCGAKLDDDACFCVHCGAKIIHNGISETTDQTLEQEHVQATDIVDGNGQEQTPTDSEIPPKNKSWFALIIGIAVVVVIAIVAFALSKKEGNRNIVTDSRAECNFNNTALFAYDDTNLYFIALFDDSDEETSLYSTSYNGTNKKLISDNSDIKRIRIRGESILYGKYNDKFVIGTMNKDGSDNTEIVTLKRGEDDALTKFDISDDMLYYVYNTELHACTLDGKNDTVLKKDIDDFVLAGNNMYYCSNGMISVYDIKKDEVNELCKAEASSMVYDNGNLYFKNEKGIYFFPIDKDGTVQKVVRDDSVTDFVIDGDNIYYIRKLSTTDIVKLAKRMATEGEDYMTYAVLMINVGTVQKVDKSGGTPEEVDLDLAFIYSLYSYPSGLYYRTSAFSEETQPLELE